MPATTKKTTTTSTTTTTTTSGSGTTYYTHYRLNAWVGLLVLSLVALLSILSVTAQKKRNLSEKWCLSMAAISLILAFLACVGHAISATRERFVSGTAEMIMAMICLGCWIFALPMITTPDDGLAVDHDFRVDNANLYFSSWGAFLFSMLLMASVGNERGVTGGRDTFARRWLFLVMSSVVVMAASSRMFEGVCQNNQFRMDGEFCRELKLGISLGVISAVIAAVMTLLLWFAPAMIPVTALGFFFAICEMILWGALVAFLTFEDGPASTVGNLFFGTWISAILALDLGVCYFMAFVS